MQTIEKRHMPSLFGPTLLIGLGFLLLLSNFGYLSTDNIFFILQLWPLLLIAIGLDLVIGRRSTWIGPLIAALLIFFAITMAWLTTPSWANWGSSGDVQTISQPLQGIERAEVTIVSGVSRLKLTASQETEQLIEGKIDPLRGEQITKHFDKVGDVGRYRIESKGTTRGFTFFGNFSNDSRWELALNPYTPIQLTVRAGVGLADLDLSALKVTKLDMETGVGTSTITLPKAGSMTARIEGGVGQVTVILPEGVAARIHANAGLGGVHVDGAYERNGDVYTSSDFDSAKERIEVRVEGGVGAVNVEQK